MYFLVHSIHLNKSYKFLLICSILKLFITTGRFLISLEQYPFNSSSAFLFPFFSLKCPKTNFLKIYIFQELEHETIFQVYAAEWHSEI